jgi:hypothetical protein
MYLSIMYDFGSRSEFIRMVKINFNIQYLKFTIQKKVFFSYNFKMFILTFDLICCI